MGETFKDVHRDLLNQGEENEMEILGYRTHSCRRALCILGYICSFGFLLLVFYWRPDWNVRANCVPCSLEEADVVLLITTDEFHQCSRKKVNWIFLAALKNSFPDDCGQLILSGEDSIINKAILRPELKVRSIKVQKIRYVWNYSEKQFQKIGALEDGLSCSAIHSTFGSGFTKEEAEARRLICGPNAIEVEVVPIWKLLFKEALNPFYIFQLFSVCLWFAEDYKEYAIAIIIMSVISIALTIYDLRKQSTKLHKLVESHNNIMTTVCRKNEGCSKLESRLLVPGDILVLTGNVLMPCDAILLHGGCIVNESMLTGESIPVTKTPLPCADSAMPWKKHSEEDYRRHVLYCGTEIIQTKPSAHGPVKAVVLRTGFNTAKGDLVRSILYPKPMNFRLYRDALRFLMCLIGAAAIGMIYGVCVFALSGESAGEVVKKALDVITIAVPPALPAALTIGIIYAQKRLEKKSIFCISPQRINMCGTLNLICFDKTGTLTEDGLDLWGIIPSEGIWFQHVYKFSSGNALPWGPLLGAMASCHSLIVLDGKIQGDPLDLKMFEGIDWEIDFVCSEENDDLTTEETMIVKPGPNSSKVPAEGIAVLHQYPFSSALQRMSVITRVVGEHHLTVYMKGAPEKVASFCQPNTVPSNFSDELQLYTLQGFRVIGLAYKPLDTKSPAEVLLYKREEVESDLIFLGLLILENRLKVETKSALQELCSARIRTVMITGDNLQTAVTVARNSSMISEESKIILVEACEVEADNSASITWKLMDDYERHKLGVSDTCIKVDVISSPAEGKSDYHFAMNGQTYQVILQHFSNLLPKLLLNGTVFARMSPGQKSSLVEEFQKLDYFVGMCGDGANDCGALKMAHAGISLSEQEASVASPFTSKTPNIECVPELIKEGRAALVTSFCVFKYMALYSMIQYLGILLLYWELNSFGNYQFLFQDLAITTVIGITMSLNHAYPKLAPYRPPAQLISPPLLLSVVLNILFSLIVQVCGFVLVQHQPWYSKDNIYSACSPANFSLSENGTTNATESQEAQSKYRSYENTTVWLLSTINCIIVAFVFSKGKPFRRPIYTNYIFVLVLAVQLGICIFFIFAEIPKLYVAMDLVCTPVLWRGFIVLALVILLIVSFTVEEAIIEHRALWLLLKKWAHFRSKSCYKKLQRALEEDIHWPPVGKTEHSLPVGMPVNEGAAAYINPVYQNDESVS
uniref:Cation-transporting ATPase n=1 Tax=Geotrypetes seraphini TaxID=260995 RepID=A0A6P8SEC0_GEOSA|nr:probable cation-transporting ATPase 13A4 isoform X1 [Geotrypetes seraphini]